MTEILITLIRYDASIFAIAMVVYLLMYGCCDEEENKIFKVVYYVAVGSGIILGILALVLIKLTRGGV